MCRKVFNSKPAMKLPIFRLVLGPIENCANSHDSFLRYGGSAILDAMPNASNWSDTSDLSDRSDPSDPAPPGQNRPDIPPRTRRRNIELKARLRDLAAARATARRVATSDEGVQQQVDTYFRCQEGRLKLREIGGVRAQLIWYRRPDVLEPKASDYYLVEVADANSLKKALETALGVRQVVAKRREVFLHENVRIHLDQVQGLGDFLEFEAVLSATDSDAAGQAAVQRLRDQFQLAAGDLIAESYLELCERKRG